MARSFVERLEAAFAFCGGSLYFFLVNFHSVLNNFFVKCHFMLRLILFEFFFKRNPSLGGFFSVILLADLYFGLGHCFRRCAFRLRFRSQSTGSVLRCPCSLCFRLSLLKTLY